MLSYVDSRREMEHSGDYAMNKTIAEYEQATGISAIVPASIV
jgi:hypothetical protein